MPKRPVFFGLACPVTDEEEDPEEGRGAVIVADELDELVDNEDVFFAAIAEGAAIKPSIKIELTRIGLHGQNFIRASPVSGSVAFQTKRMEHREM